MVAGFVVNGLVLNSPRESNMHPCNLEQSPWTLTHSSEHNSEPCCSSKASAGVTQAANSASAKVPCLGAKIKVKNTFLTLVVDDGLDEEMISCRAVRRRVVKSCPFSIESKEWCSSSWSPRDSVKDSDEDNQKIKQSCSAPLSQKQSSTRESRLLQQLLDDMQPSTPEVIELDNVHPAPSVVLTELMIPKPSFVGDHMFDERAPTDSGAKILRSCDLANVETEHSADEVANAVGFSNGKCQWHGAQLRVKNTFITLVVDDSLDKEMISDPRARRRALKSCPFSILTKEHCCVTVSDENGHNAEQSCCAPRSQKRVSTLEIRLLNGLLDEMRAVDGVPVQQASDSHIGCSDTRYSILDDLQISTLVLTELMKPSPCCVLDLMIDEPTPTALGAKILRNHDSARADIEFSIDMASLPTCTFPPNTLLECRASESTADIEAPSNDRSPCVVALSSSIHRGFPSPPQVEKKSENSSDARAHTNDGSPVATADGPALPAPLRWPKCCRFSSDVRKYCAAAASVEVAEVPSPLRWPKCSRFSDDDRKQVSEFWR